MNHKPSCVFLQDEFQGLLLSVWFLHLVRAEGDPIPEEMYEKIAGGAVSSISDLRRLLQIDSVGQALDEPYHSRNETRSLPWGYASHARVIRSLDVEPAVIAECKTRAEVFEITRKLVDPTNANFLVWPPCVEVQRCSGCCNTKHMRCAPSRIHIRIVQVPHKSLNLSILVCPISTLLTHAHLIPHLGVASCRTKPLCPISVS
ncbi:hypothetical protein FKM82_026466 [Ascaphus truei]